MAQASTHLISLSQLFTDPMVRRAFERAERDAGNAFAVPVAPEPFLSGGAAASRELVAA